MENIDWGLAVAAIALFATGVWALLSGRGVDYEADYYHYNDRED